jgi:hypothetical protein
MNEWINNCNKEELSKVIQATKRIDNNYKRMKDSTILKKLINGNITIISFFQYIEKPSKKIQLAAVMENGNLIKYIKDPCKEVKLTAVKQFGYAILHIKNPSKEVKLAAARQNSMPTIWLAAGNPSEAIVVSNLTGHEAKGRKHERMDKQL